MHINVVWGCRLLCAVVPVRKLRKERTEKHVDQECNASHSLSHLPLCMVVYEDRGKGIAEACVSVSTLFAKLA